MHTQVPEDARPGSYAQETELALLYLKSILPGRIHHRSVRKAQKKGNKRAVSFGMHNMLVKALFCLEFDILSCQTANIVHSYTTHKRKDERTKGKHKEREREKKKK